MDRIEQLMQFISEDPEDPFNHYALALEFLKIGDSDRALQEFTHVMTLHPSYLPNYYHFGKLLESSGKTVEAKQLYERGIIVAIKAGDRKTAAELQAALDLMD